MMIDVPIWSMINFHSFTLTLEALFAIFRLGLPVLIVLLAAYWLVGHHIPDQGNPA